MKKLNLFVCVLALSISTPVLADNDEVTAGKVLSVIESVFGKPTQDKNVQVALAGAETLIAMNESNCDASSGSACQAIASGAANQNAGANQNNTQVAAGGVQRGIFMNRGNGSATGGSANQSAAAIAGNQNATGLRE